MKTISINSPIIAVALAFLAPLACGGGDETPPVDRAALVSASGTLSGTRGQLEVAVSPQDENGNFVGQDLPDSAFEFEAVTLRSASGGIAIDTSTKVTEVIRKQPDAGHALSAVVVFDSSGSMATNDPGAVGRRQAGEALFSNLDDADEVAVVDFGAGTSEGLDSSRLLQPFTSDGDELTAALQSLQESGGTPLYESLADALGLLDERTSDGGVVVVLTDGQASGGGLEQVIDRAVARGTEIYAVGLGDTLDFAELARLGQETGGGMVTATDSTLLNSTFAGIAAGVSVGRVVVRGLADYDLLPSSGLFEVSGLLVTRDSHGTVETPFAFLTLAE